MTQNGSNKIEQVNDSLLYNRNHPASGTVYEKCTYSGSFDHVCLRYTLSSFGSWTNH